MYIDSHAHLSSDAFQEKEWESLIQRAQSEGVQKIVNICSDYEALEKGLILKEKHANIYLAAACPPHTVLEDSELYDEVVKALPHLVAIGETGLDYYYGKESAEVQKKECLRYLSLALEKDLPVIIHCREAFKDFFSLIDQVEEKFQRKLRGVLHCFTGSKEEALELVQRSWYISYSGIVTFKKSESLRGTLEVVPLNSLLIETDAPYLAPPPFRGKRNESSYLPFVAKVIASEKGCSLEEVALASRNNAEALFKLAP